MPALEEDTVAVNVTLFFTSDGFALDVSTVEVAAGFTTSESGAEVLPAKLRSPAYEAVIECDPRVRLATESCAALFERLAVPSEFPPSKNVTAPLAWSPLMEGMTVAVKTTACPNVAGLGLAPTVTVEPAGLIVSVNAVEVLAI